MSRPYKLIHQVLTIEGISFEKRLLVGFVELHLLPLQPDIQVVKLNCKQCRLYKVLVNEVHDAEFEYNDPTLELCQGDATQRNLHFFQSCQMAAVKSVDPDKGNGEVTIHLPPDCWPPADEQPQRPLKIIVGFSLREPQGGIQFVTPRENDGQLLRQHAHMFSYSSPRLWFPCIDSYSEHCTWKIEIVVDNGFTAVTCGDLIETRETPDGAKKTFTYQLTVPTAAPNIALAVGAFEILVDPYMHEVTHFCLPQLKPLLKTTTSFIHEAFEFYEEILSSRYPYSTYKQVFVDEACTDMQAYATMAILSTNLLHSPRIIDQTPLSRIAMVHAVAQQFFGCFISKTSWCDSWLTVGIAKYLEYQVMKSTFGSNEYHRVVAVEMRAVSDYEQNVMGIVLDPSSLSSSKASTYFNVKSPESVPPKYYEMYCKKAGLIMRMLENKLGKELILQVFAKMLLLARLSSQQPYSSGMWNNLSLSTKCFLKLVSAVTGKDIQGFVDTWVCQSGCARFLGSFVFSRKRNVVLVSLEPDITAKGSLKYVGPITMTIQELDGSFTHTFKIEEKQPKLEITCHSKSRRNKKKKIPLMTGEEVDMDLANMDPESPVLWLRVDPDMHIYRDIKWQQPDYMWQYQLKYERDIVAQLEAIEALQQFPTANTRSVLNEVLENDRFFYKVREKAAHALATVATMMASSWSGPPPMVMIFKKMFCSQSCNTIVRQNKFNNFQNYFLQKTIPTCVAGVRNAQGLSTPEVLRFTLDLLKYNDNSRNKFSDSHYRAALVDAIGRTITPAIAVVGQNVSLQTMSSDARAILDEVVRNLNLEKVLPSYRYVVTVSCLRVLRQLQKNAHLPSNSHLFESYSRYGMFVDVRLAAIEIIVGFAQEGTAEREHELNFILNIVETDPVPSIRLSTLMMLSENPPFKNNAPCPLNAESLVNRLWSLINCKTYFDSQLCCEAANLYYVLYGMARPHCLPDSGAASSSSGSVPTNTIASGVAANGVTTALKVYVSTAMDVEQHRPGDQRISGDDAHFTAFHTSEDSVSNHGFVASRVDGDASLDACSGIVDTDRAFKVKKKKKKNKHRHKHKHIKKRGLDDDQVGGGNSSSTSHKRQSSGGAASVVALTHVQEPTAVPDSPLLALSEPSSPETM